MNDDLTTLLRDAGREPTIELDVDAVHTRGRRRELGRRTALAAGTLAVLGVAGVGIAQLLTPEPVPFVDEVPPSEAPAEDAAPADGGGPDDATAPADALAVRSLVDVAADTGLAATLVRFEGGGFDVTTATPDAVAAEARWSDVTMLGRPVVTTDGAVWGLSPDGDVVRFDPEAGAAEPVLGADEGAGKLPVSSVEEAGVLLVDLIGESPTDEPRELRVLRMIGPSTGEVTARLSGVTLADAVEDDEQVFAADVEREHVVLGLGIGESYRVVQVPFGGEPVEVFSTGGLDRWLLDVALVDGEVWVLEAVAGPEGPASAEVQLHRVGLDGAAFATHAVGGQFAALVDRIVPLAGVDGPGGGPVVLQGRDEAEVVRSFVVDPAALRERGDLAAATVALAEPGGLTLRPHEASSPVPGCGSDPLAAMLDTLQLESVWFPCTGTTSSRGPTMFLPRNRFTAASFPDEQARLEAFVGAVFDGPDADEQALGLERVVTEDVATLGGVTIDGTTVTVDVAAGPQVGVLGTSFGGSVLTSAIVGAVLQFDAYDTVVLTLDGDCEAWASLREGSGCATYDVTATPWGRPDGFAP